MLGIGDDAAVLKVSKNQRQVITTDTLVAERHFRMNDPAFTIGHKSLAVSISDIAAMGALPRWATLNLTLPKHEEIWISGFLDGFIHLLQQYHIQLVGGDTTQGPLSISVTLIGEAKEEHIKKRSAAEIDDLIVVSGQLGSAAYALDHQDANETIKQQLQQPMPRLDLVEPLRSISNAVIDISDGLLADLNHICIASGLGASIQTEKIPMHPDIKNTKQGLSYALNGGDDYQLCFTCNSRHENSLPDDCHIIGKMTNSLPLKVWHNENLLNIEKMGYEHFSN